MRKAVIDLGTNSCLLLIAEMDSNHKPSAPLPTEAVVCDLVESPRLGDMQGDSGKLHSEAIYRALDTLKNFRQICKEKGIDASEIKVVGTAVLRKASNANDVINAAKDRLGLHIKILDSKEEAILSFKGACPPGISAEDISLIDIGGGSTELAVFKNNKLISKSFPIGAVHLLGNDKASEIIKNTFSLEKPMEEFLKKKCLGVAGTVVTSAMLIAKKARFDSKALDGTNLKKSQLINLLDQLNALTNEERKNLVGMPKGREDIIIPGLEILINWMHRIEKEEILVSTRGLRYGVLMHEDLSAI